MNPLFLMLVTLLLGFIVFVAVIPHAHREETARLFIPIGRFIRRQLRRFKALSEIGGYVHDTAMAQYISPNLINTGTVGTWTYPAGEVAGTIVAHCAAAAQTATVLVPVMIPSNSVSGKGSLLKYVELDYQILVLAATSVTLSIVKVVRGADTAVAVVSAPAGTQTLTPATTAATADKHRDRFTLTTPAYIGDGEYYFLKAVIVQAATTQIDILGAVAYFTERI